MSFCAVVREFYFFSQKTRSLIVVGMRCMLLLRRTFKTAVAGSKIRLEFREARVDPVKRLVRQRDFTTPPARADGVGQTKYVGRTADEAEVVFDAATEPHATVACRLHDDYFVGG